MWPYAFLPVIVALAGALWTSLYAPGEKLIGAVQHFAAGVVFFAAAGEILPNVLHEDGPWPIALGATVGIAAMLYSRHVTEILRGRVSFIAAAAVDALTDGLILGLGFNAGRRQGLLLAVALAVEFLFLGLSIAGALRRSTSRVTVVGMTAAVALTVPIGVLIAQPISRLSSFWQLAAFTFGLVALLYLVTEELLTEAHRRPETAWGTAMFYVGFFTLALIDHAMES